MASTTAGQGLTEAHRVAQINLGVDTEIEAGVLVDRYLTGPAPSRTAWLASSMIMLRSRWRHSQRLARAYLSEFDGAEIGTGARPVVEIPFPQTSAAVKMSALVPPGLALVELGPADLSALAGQVAAQAAQTAMAGGRSTIDRTARHRRRRYRRVSDGNPCAFCAMLASRGPAYSEETAYFRAHEHCGCTAELVYGTWEPSALEREWVTAYEDAAEEARAAGQPVLAPHGRQRRDTVLWRMRRNRPDLFSDGIYPKAA